MNGPSIDPFVSDVDMNTHIALYDSRVGFNPNRHIACVDTLPMCKPITKDISTSLCLVSSPHASHPPSICLIEKNQICLPPLLSDSFDITAHTVDVCDPMHIDTTSCLGLTPHIQSDCTLQTLDTFVHELP